MVSKENADNTVEVVPCSVGGIIDITEDDDVNEICEVEHLRKLFIGGLPSETTDEKLRKFYSKWGEVVDSVVMKDSVTGRSKGFGFVTYTRISMVDKAQANRPHIIDNKAVESKRALPRPQQPIAEPKKTISVKKLFVGGLKDSHDEQCLKEYFSQFGNVVAVKILVDNTTGKRRGFAFIEYDDYDAVDKAILQENHCVKSVLLDVRKSIYTQDKKKETPDKNGMNKGNTQNRNQGIRPDIRIRSDQLQNNMPSGTYTRGYPNGGIMDRQPPPMSAPPPPKNQPQPQMPQYQQGPPPSYNQFGPPQPHPQSQTPIPYVQPPPPPQQYQQPMPPQYYGNYQQQPPMPPAQPPIQPVNWNGYPPAGNNWNAPPPQAPIQPPPPNWQNNQWPTPVARTPMPMPMPMPMPPRNQPPPPNWQQPPNPQNAGPPPHQQPPAMYPPQQQQPPPPPPLPNNLGNGYQQNYGGGPVKHSYVYSNRPNPYGAPSNQYNNPPGQGYGNPMPNNGNKYRR